MCEVTKRNFDKIYPQVVDDLHSATFISIDCEFSGLFDDDSTISLFDTPKVRFQKLQTRLDEVKIIQFGLSTFKYEKTKNTFAVASYTFYLKPSTVIKKQKLVCQMGSVEFLCKNNFDFNKLFYDGVFYLNQYYEKIALNLIKEGSLVDSNIHEDIQKYCSRVSEWIRTATEDSEMLIELHDETNMFMYILHGEIRKRFPQAWTFFGENNIRVKKIKYSNKKFLSAAEEEILLRKKLFDSILGFSKVIKELENLKKPIIGHNLLIDLILIYKQFYNPLPVTYKYFKTAITKIFPIIFDTKFISFKLREILSRDTLWSSNSLSDLYTYLKDGKGATLVIFTPIVNHKNESFVNESHFHEAGFDSYCTGYCFLKMAHTFSFWDTNKQSFFLTSFPASSKWLLEAVSGMKNKLNLSRAQNFYIVLDGNDPESTRPSILYIYSRTKKPLDLSKLTEITAKYASVDIQLLSKYSGLLAASNRQQVREIRERLKSHGDYNVTNYNFLKHSKTGKTILTGTAIFSVVLIAVLISNRWR